MDWTTLGRLSANSTRPGEKVTQDKEHEQELDKSPTAGSVDSTRTGQVELSSLELGELWTSHPDPPCWVSDRGRPPLSERFGALRAKTTSRARAIGFFLVWGGAGMARAWRGHVLFPLGKTAADADRTIDFKETDADRTRAWPFLPGVG
eukprot:gene12159-biopygen15475